MPTVTFIPSGRTVQVKAETSLAEACRTAGFVLSTPCGGKGLCGKCRVLVLAGAGETDGADARQQSVIPKELLDEGWRCACLVPVRGDMTVRDPEGGGECVVTTEFLVRDPRGGCDGGGVGLAVDVGTTTIAAALCDMTSGAVLATAGCANPQASRGGDVVSRMDYIGNSPERLDEMRSLVVRAMEDLAARTLSDAGYGPSHPVDRIAVGGNTVMTHIVLGRNPYCLAVAPFTPAYEGAAERDAARMDWRGGGKPVFLAVPHIGAYVGGDVTAGLLAHGVGEGEGCVLFLDIGTNGEIVLQAGGELFACATAAGPAFEGGKISHGMRAEAGAIGGVRLDDDGRVRVEVLGGGEAADAVRGICGSGVLDAVGVLLDAGVMDEGGRLLEREEAEEEGVSEDVLSRVGENAEGVFFRLGDGPEGDVTLTQRDVREVQLAKGAVAAGTRVLLSMAGVAAEKAEDIVLAGGFGRCLRPESALRIGLLPPEIDVEKVRAVGNAALAGTRLYLLSKEERVRAEELCRRVRYVSLSGHPEFSSLFAGEMLFPVPS